MSRWWWRLRLRFSACYRALKGDEYLCPPSVDEQTRVDRLRSAIYSQEPEVFHEVHCMHCDRLWCVNQWHQGPFSCGDYVRHSDYERAVR